jgi:hypothetical protein
VAQDVAEIKRHHQVLFENCIKGISNEHSHPTHPELADVEEKMAKERERLCKQFKLYQAEIDKSAST